ncbi:murein L,D-transpeptidase [Rhodoplanes sp. TEM]|uniref:Murein L,D-transpeptidase n=1 Tax=Rhodoplanes tepidamans TaxID=200616 RepID=A0ABT5JJD1_RHOTP|nr:MULTISPECIES: murein L,D-transpeptidase family protein [Rhodoplanes]MDC7789637.1 murein L,D-transpeptidase [Rhodoplanes tepidamans]MDC7987391.1 murein L,D-transpeptidase [Rhodoplanes sp. TEM]MDQ0359172.1 murein L,D-transpeptidase YafK [Rhodoplanes tepidamans]
MIRVAGLRMLVLAAALAAAAAPIRGLAQDAPPAKTSPERPPPDKATRELPPDLLALLREKRMPKHSPIVLRVFKEEAELEVWKQDAGGRFALLKTYPICRWSGDLGPKFVEGDRQAPEGFYTVTPALMNPHSNYHLAINTGFPNSFDKANGRTGSLLMIHGDCASAGCYAMTDAQISEIYGLARDALAGRPWFQIQAFPFRLTPANLARHRNSPNLPFWTMLKVGSDHFETTRREPKVDVCERRYVFDARPRSSAATPVVFDPAGRCPPHAVDPTIAGPVSEKQRADAAETARLVARLTADGVPAAPIYTGLDGGMHESFRARFVRVVIPLSKVMPYASHLPTLPPIPWVDDDGSVARKWFGTAF